MNKIDINKNQFSDLINLVNNVFYPLKNFVSKEEFKKIIDNKKVDIIIGGPPCQPFSVGGKQLGLNDSRDGFPAFIHAIKTVKPKIWMFENVRGMLYRNKTYLKEITDLLQDIGYLIEVKIVKAVELGVPQNRERLIIVGHQGGYKFPSALDIKFTAGDAVSDIAYNIKNNDILLQNNITKN